MKLKDVAFLISVYKDAVENLSRTEVAILTKDYTPDEAAKMAGLLRGERFLWRELGEVDICSDADADTIWLDHGTIGMMCHLERYGFDISDFPQRRGRL